MTMNRARLGLLGIFLTFLIAQITAFLLVGYKMWPEDLESLILKLLTIYSVPLTVVLGGIFAQLGGHTKKPSPGVVWTALILAGVWNGLLLWRSIAFSLASQDSASGLIKYLDAVSSGGSFLVAGALTFFFTKSAESRRPAGRP